MSRITFLLAGVLIGGLTVVLAFNYHMVQTSDKLLFVAKQTATLTDTWVDIRTWSVQDWAGHPQLSQDLIKAGHGDLITKSVAGGMIQDALNNLPQQH